MNEEKKATSGIAFARITAVVGMGFTMASGILLLVGGWLLAGGIALLAFVPFFLFMRYLEGREAEEE